MLLALHLYFIKFYTLEFLSNNPVYIEMQQHKQNFKVFKHLPRIFIFIISDFFFLNDWIVYQSLFGININGMETDSIIF